jgi:hypothetical protein
MQTSTLDLWPQDIAAAADLSAPVGILREQAFLLGQRTNNIVEGEVLTRGKHDEFTHEFYLVAPAFEHYRYLLLSVTHKAEMYPLKINVRGNQVEAQSQAEFVERLRSIFADPATKNVIQSLIAQSQ